MSTTSPPVIIDFPAGGKSGYSLRVPRGYIILSARLSRRLLSVMLLVNYRRRFCSYCFAGTAASATEIASATR